MDIIEEIKRLKSLLDNGAINEDEFNLLKKNALLNNKNSRSTGENPSSESGNPGSENADINQAAPDRGSEFINPIKNEENYSTNINHKSSLSLSGKQKAWIIGIIIVIALYFIGVFSDDWSGI